MALPEPDTQAPLAALIDAAWAAQFDEPARIRPLAETLLARAPAGSAEAGWGWLHRAWAARFERDAPAADAALAQARCLFTRLGCERGLACVADINRRERLARGEREDDEAGSDAADAAERPGALAIERGAWERLVGLYGHFAAADRHGRPDTALRLLYRAVRAARETAHAGALANTLSMLGAKHAEVGDLDAARTFCLEAWQQAASLRAKPVWQIAALNLLFVEIELGARDAASALADLVEHEMPRVLPHALEQAQLLVARARLLEGRTRAAQAAIERSRQGGAAQHQGEWIATRAEWLLAAGEPAAALDTCTRWIEAGGARGAFVTPGDTLRVHRAAAVGAERLGQLGLALRFERSAQALYEAQLGRAARTRRIALAIEHELERERWQRERAEAERERLDALNRALAEASAAKTRFLAAASHDLRQPVQALALNMAALEHEAVTPAQAELVQRMSASLQALSQMFDVLLDISRLDAGIVPVAPAPVSLAGLLQRLQQELTAGAAARGLRLRLRLAAGAHEAATQSDAVLLERCLRNLLDNALKYTPAGGVLVTLRRRGEEWQLRVNDSGIGMSAEVLARATEEFFQADNPERDRCRGLGLGLALVQRMSRLLGHRFELASRPGRGTTATLWLRADAAPAAGAELGAAAGASVAPGYGGLIGVIDDDAEVRHGLADLLRRWGHAVLAEGDTRALCAAWRAAGEPVFAGLVVDLRLRGGEDGVRAVATLRATVGRAVPALVITGDTATERLQRLRESGLPWLAKPVMPLRLRGWLHAAARGG